MLHLAKPLGGPPADLGCLEFGGEDIGGQEVVLDEVPQAPADPVLAVGDDGGVGDGDIEGMAKQGGNGEPVGDAADHGGLRRGPDVAEPGMLGLIHPGDHEDDPHQNQEPGRPDLHPVKIALALLRVGDVLHGGHARRYGGGAEGRRGGKLAT